MAMQAAVGLLDDDDTYQDPGPSLREYKKTTSDPDWETTVDRRLTNIEAQLEMIIKQLQELTTIVKNIQATRMRMHIHTHRDTSSFI